MKKLFAIFCLSLTLSAQSAPKNEAEINAYRLAMKDAGIALKNNQNQTAFNKILPFAKQGFAEAQYIIATMYHDGVGTAQNLNEAKKWYITATQSNNNEVANLAREGLDSLSEK